MSNHNHYLVHWDGYQANLQAAVEKQFVAESFVDVTLAVEAGLIKCHKMVLCASSAYFQQLLAQHNCPHPIIFMRDMQYWEVIALVDFMYRGEVSIEEDKLEPLMRAAQTLQIHGLSACLKACVERTTNKRVAKVETVHDQMEEGDDSQDSVESGGPEESLLEPQVELSTTINKLCELNSELELRPITSTKSSRSDSKNLLLEEQAVPTSQKKVVKEEIEVIEDNCELSPSDMEPEIQIQSVFCQQSEEKAENSDDCVVTEDDHPTENSRTSQPGQSFPQYLLVRPIQGLPIRPQPAYHKMSLHETPLYKRYSPHSLEQALQDLQTGRFRSIRACARHHGIPMTTLRYRAKGSLRRPPWMQE